MNYLITGATGFIGKAFVDLLLSQGNGVNYLARKRGASMDSRAAYFCWNPEGEPPLECAGRLDIIVHLAGEPVAQRWNAQVKQRIRESRILGTRNLVSAIEKLKHRPCVLVSACAIGYYGDRGDEVLTEDSPPGDGFLADVCREWENEALRARSFGLRVVPVRIGVVLGKGGGALEKMVQPFKFGLGGTLGDGRQWMSWIHRDDLIRMLQFAAENPEVTGPLNGVSPHPVTNKDFTRTLAAALHRPALFQIPKLALKLTMGEMGHHVVESARVIPRAAQRFGFEYRYPELSPALAQALAEPERTIA